MAIGVSEMHMRGAEFHCEVSQKSKYRKNEKTGSNNSFEKKYVIQEVQRYSEKKKKNSKPSSEATS